MESRVLFLFGTAYKLYPCKSYPRTVVSATSVKGVIPCIPYNILFDTVGSQAHTVLPCRSVGSMSPMYSNKKSHSVTRASESRPHATTGLVQSRGTLVRRTVEQRLLASAEPPGQWADECCGSAGGSRVRRPSLGTNEPRLPDESLDF